MSDYIKVDPVVESDSGTSTALVALIVTVIAAVIIGLAVWQPWAVAPSSPSNSTTIIHDKETQTPAPQSNNPVIIQQPSQKAPDTNVNIHNDVKGTDAGSGSASSNNGSN